MNNMRFTTPCFIKTEITDSLIEKVKNLGYRITPNGYGEWFIPKERCHYLSCNKDTYQGEEIYYCITRVGKPQGYECLNEQEFLAVAALSNETAKNQWFTDGMHWEKCPEDKANLGAWHSKYQMNPHKATLEELREHFKDIEANKIEDKKVEISKSYEVSISITVGLIGIALLGIIFALSI